MLFQLLWYQLLGSSFQGNASGFDHPQACWAETFSHVETRYGMPRPSQCAVCAMTMCTAVPAASLIALMSVLIIKMPTAAGLLQHPLLTSQLLFCKVCCANY